MYSTSTGAAMPQVTFDVMTIVHSYSVQSSSAGLQVPEVAFTGDTQIEFADLPENADVLQAKLLIMECTFVDDTVDVARAKENGHTHIRDLVQYADKFQVCLPAWPASHRGPSG